MTRGAKITTFPRVLKRSLFSLTGISSFLPVVLLGAVVPFGAAVLEGAEPLASATVSRVENKVSYGKVLGETSEMRPAAADDVVKANNFLLSESDSRAELKYEDGTIVRIGQNTVFTFEANTRTLNLKKGTFVFYVPKGKGGGTIKTPSLTAAITGTIGKVSDNIIAVVEGEITLIPSGRKVSQGNFARMNPDGSIDILPFDQSKAFDGKLMTFNGPLPGIPETQFGSLESFLAEMGALGDESLGRANNNPSQVIKSNPVPTPKPTPGPTPHAAQPTPAPTPPPLSKPPISSPPPDEEGGGI